MHELEVRANCLVEDFFESCLLDNVLNGSPTNTKIEIAYNQGIIDCKSNGNSANFFSYVCNSKKNKELFASALNTITASVICVSSMIVAQNAKST